MNTRIPAAIATGTALLMAVPAGAMTINITTDPRIVLGGPELRPYVTFEDKAASPPSVTARWSDNQSETLSWGLHAAPFCGGVVSSLFSLGGCGDTFTENWVLTNLRGAGVRLTNLVVDFVGTPFWFDRTRPSPGTPDSVAGRDFEFIGPESVCCVINVEYSLLHNVVFEDAWKRMTVDFTGLSGGGVENTLRFRQDTDTVIPVPAALPLLLTGIGLLGALRLRRRTA